jgi:hypothetical protein
VGSGHFFLVSACSEMIAIGLNISGICKIEMESL